MPERIYNDLTVQELLSLRKDLREGTSQGSIELIAAAGVTAKVSGLSNADRLNRIRDVRYEIYVRGRGLFGAVKNTQCAVLEPRNPLQERVMSVGVNRNNSPFLPRPAGFI